MAALPGAVQTSVFQSGLGGKPLAGLRLALGAALVDGSYIALAYFGLIQFMSDNKLMLIILSIIGIGYMAFLGINGLRKSLKKNDIEEKSVKGGFFKGMILVIAHPATAVYFIGVSSTLFSQNEITKSTVVLSSLFLFSGAIICFILVALIGLIVHKFGKIKLIKIFEIVTSLMLIFFAGKLIWQLVFGNY